MSPGLLIFISYKQRKKETRENSSRNTFIPPLPDRWQPELSVQSLRSQHLKSGPKWSAMQAAHCCPLSRWKTPCMSNTVSQDGHLQLCQQHPQFHAWPRAAKYMCAHGPIDYSKWVWAKRAHGLSRERIHKAQKQHTEGREGVGGTRLLALELAVPPTPALPPYTLRGKAAFSPGCGPTGKSRCLEYPPRRKGWLHLLFHRIKVLFPDLGPEHNPQISTKMSTDRGSRECLGPGKGNDPGPNGNSTRHPPSHPRPLIPHCLPSPLPNPMAGFGSSVLFCPS